MRTYKVHIDGDNTLENLFSFVNNAAAEAVNKIMLCEQRTDRTWKISEQEYSNYDTVSEFNKQYPQININDAKEFWNYCLEKEFAEEQLCGVFQGTARKDLGSFKNAYDNLLKQKFFPLFTLHTENGVNRSIINAVCRRLSSFIECDKLTQTRFNKLNDEYSNLIGEMSEEDATNIKDLLEFTKNNFCTKDENVAKFLGSKFCAFIKYILIPNANVDLSIGRYSYVNDKKQKKIIYYQANNNVITFINSRQNLANAIVKYYHIIDLFDKISRGKCNSRITIPDKNFSPIDLHFGCNYIPQKIENINGEYFVSDIGNKIFKNPYKMCWTKKMGGVYQLMNLKLVQALRTENGKGSKCDTPTRYKISFDVNGKHHREGYLKEFSIQCRNNVYTMNLTFGDNFSSPIESIYHCGLDKAKEKKYQNILNDIINKKGFIRCLGVDIGINPLFGWSVVDSYDTLGKNTKIIEHNNEGITIKDSEFMKLYYSLLNSIKSFDHILNMTKYHINDKNPITDQTIDEVKDHIKNFNCISYDDLINLLSDHSKQITEIKSSWCLKKIRKHIMLIFGMMKDYRRKNNQLSTPNEAVYMVNAINRYISILTKYNRIGYFNPNKASYVDTFKELWNYRDNLYDDVLKKLSHFIVYTAVQKKCDFIAVENLELTFKNNDLSNIFSYGEFKNKIEQISAMYQLPVIEVDPTATSQINPVSGEWGYRDLNDFDGDFISEDLNKFDSDSYVAASNIAKRALCFHGDLKIIKVKGDGINWIPYGAGTRIRGMFGLKIDDSFSIINGDIKKNSKNKSFNTSIVKRFYLHNKKWVDEDAHNTIINSIKIKYKQSCERIGG